MFGKVLGAAAAATLVIAPVSVQAAPQSAPISEPMAMAGESRGTTIGVLFALLAIVIAVIEFLWDAWRPYSAILGRAEGVQGFHDIKRYPGARMLPGLVLFRWDAPLFFANAELFSERVLDAVAASPTPVRWLVVAAEPVTSVDVTSADMLAELLQTLREAGIELCVAEMKDPVKDKLKRFGLLTQFGESAFFPTVGSAVSGYLKNYPQERRQGLDADYE